MKSSMVAARVYLLLFGAGCAVANGEDEMHCTITQQPMTGYCCLGNPNDSAMVEGKQRGDNHNHPTMCIDKVGDVCRNDADPGSDQLCCDRNGQIAEGSQAAANYGCEEKRCSLTSTPDAGYCCQGNPNDSLMVEGEQRGEGFNHPSMCKAKVGDDCTNDADPGDFFLCCDINGKISEGTQTNDDYGCHYDRCTLSMLPGEGYCCQGIPREGADAPLMVKGEKRGSDFNHPSMCKAKVGDGCSKDDDPGSNDLCCRNGRIAEGSQISDDYSCEPKRCSLTSTPEDGYCCQGNPRDSLMVEGAQRGEGNEPSRCEAKVGDECNNDDDPGSKFCCDSNGEIAEGPQTRDDYGCEAGGDSGDGDDLRCSPSTRAMEGYCCLGNPMDSRMVRGEQRGSQYNHESMCVAKEGDKCTKNDEPGTPTLCCDRARKMYRMGSQRADDYACEEEDEPIIVSPEELECMKRRKEKCMTEDGLCFWHSEKKCQVVPDECSKKPKRSPDDQKKMIKDLEKAAKKAKKKFKGKRTDKYQKKYKKAKKALEKAERELTDIKKWKAQCKR